MIDNFEPPRNIELDRPNKENHLLSKWWMCMQSKQMQLVGYPLMAVIVEWVCPIALLQNVLESIIKYPAITGQISHA